MIISLYDQLTEFLSIKGYSYIKRRKAKKPDFHQKIGNKLRKMEEFEFSVICRDLLSKLLNPANLDNLDNQPVLEIIIDSYIIQVCKEDLKTASNRGFSLTRETNELIKVLKSTSFFIKQENDYDRDANQLPVENGVISFTKEGMKYSDDKVKSMTFFQRINASYREEYIHEGLPHLFMKIINEGLFKPDISPQENENRVNAFLNCLAYMFIPGNYYCKLFIIYGAAQAGKSKLMDILRIIFGYYGIAIDASSIITHSRTNPELRSDLYRLDDKLFITVSETEKTKKLDSRLLKTITGGDNISVRTLFSDTFSDSKISGNIFIISNFYPIFANPEDRAIHERVVAIDWYNTVSPENRIQDLVEKLTTPEMCSRIFSCLLSRATKLYNNGNVQFDVRSVFPYMPPAEPLNDKRIKESIFEHFCNEGFLCSDDIYLVNCYYPLPLSGKDIHFAYVQFCRNHGYAEEHILKERSFLMKWGPYVKSLNTNESTNIGMISYSNGNFYTGIQIKPELLCQPYLIKLPGSRKFDRFTRNFPPPNMNIF